MFRAISWRREAKYWNRSADSSREIAKSICRILRSQESIKIYVGTNRRTLIGNRTLLAAIQTLTDLSDHQASRPRLLFKALKKKQFSITLLHFLSYIWSKNKISIEQGKFTHPVSDKEKKRRTEDETLKREMRDENAKSESGKVLVPTYLLKQGALHRNHSLDIGWNDVKISFSNPLCAKICRFRTTPD